MSWDRPTLKSLAKAELRYSYGLSLVACIIGGLLGAYASGGSSRTTVTQQVSDMPHFNIVNIGNFFYITDYASQIWFRFLVMIPYIIFALVFAFGYTALIANPIQVGMARFFTQAPRGDRTLSNLLWGFTGGHYGRVVTAMFMRQAIVWIGYVCFVFPGIYLSYVYRMVPYILAQNPGIAPGDAMRMSADMTHGDKFNIFVLDLSFIGWYILGSLFFGIGQVFVYPYVEATFAQLYGVIGGHTGGGGGGYGGYGGDYRQDSGTSAQDYRSAQNPYNGGDAEPDYRNTGWPGGGENRGSYTPPPPPPYGRHRDTPPPEKDPWDNKGR